jgi:hypothetical protein
LHANDTGSIALPENVTVAIGIKLCSRACCAASNCKAWVTGPKDGTGPDGGKPWCFLKSEGAVGSKRWVLKNWLAAYGIAPNNLTGSARLTALRDTTLKKSELFSGDLPPSKKRSVLTGEVWDGLVQMDSNYWLVRPMQDSAAKTNDGIAVAAKLPLQHLKTDDTGPMLPSGKHNDQPPPLPVRRTYHLRHGITLTAGMPVLVTSAQAPQIVSTGFGSLGMIGPPGAERVFARATFSPCGMNGGARQCNSSSRFFTSSASTVGGGGESWVEVEYGLGEAPTPTLGGCAPGRAITSSNGTRAVCSGGWLWNGEAEGDRGGVGPAANQNRSSGGFNVGAQFIIREDRVTMSGLFRTNYTFPKGRRFATNDTGYCSDPSNPGSCFLTTGEPLPVCHWSPPALVSVLTTCAARHDGCCSLILQGPIPRFCT